MVRLSRPIVGGLAGPGRTAVGWAAGHCLRPDGPPWSVHPRGRRPS